MHPTSSSGDRKTPPTVEGIPISQLRQHLERLNQALPENESQVLYLENSALRLKPQKESTGKKQNRLPSPTPSIFVHEDVLKTVKYKLQKSLKQLDDETKKSQVNTALKNIRKLAQGKSDIRLDQLLTHLSPIENWDIKPNYKEQLIAQHMIIVPKDAGLDNIDNAIIFLNKSRNFLIQNEEKNLKIRRGKTKDNQIILYLSDKNLKKTEKENIETAQNRKNQNPRTASKGEDKAVDFFKGIIDTIIEKNKPILSDKIIHLTPRLLKKKDLSISTIKNLITFFEATRNALITEQARQLNPFSEDRHSLASANQEPRKVRHSAPEGMLINDPHPIGSPPKVKKKKNRPQQLMQKFSRKPKEKADSQGEIRKLEKSAEEILAERVPAAHRPDITMSTTSFRNQPAKVSLIRPSTTASPSVPPQIAAPMTHPVMPPDFAAPQGAPAQRQSRNPVLQFFSWIASIVSNFFGSVFSRF